MAKLEYKLLFGRFLKNFSMFLQLYCRYLSNSKNKNCTVKIWISITEFPLIITITSEEATLKIKKGSV